MSNPLFNQLNSNNLMSFPQFMMSMRGKNPTQIINAMLSSGQLSQSQLGQAINQARQMEQQFEQFRSMFGFKR